MSVMLYKVPGPYVLHDVECDYIIVEEDEVAEKLEAGWERSPARAAKAALKEGLERIPFRTTLSKDEAKKKLEPEKPVIEPPAPEPEPPKAEEPEKPKKRRGRPPKKKAEEDREEKGLIRPELLEPEPGEGS